jgi:hypothetical protein
LFSVIVIAYAFGTSAENVGLHVVNVQGLASLPMVRLSGLQFFQLDSKLLKNEAKIQVH